MWIAPNTDIKILSNCPLDNTYEHTIKFTDSYNQQLYFSSLAKFELDEYSYQRHNKGSIKVAVKMESLFDCNYIMFKNSSFENKWFYAFITGINYINNESSEIIYEIDVLQTWAFDYSLQKCFVEREHSSTDVIGENTIPEGLELGQYMYADLGIDERFSEFNIVVAATFDTTLQAATGGLYGGVYSGICYNVFTNVSAVNSFLTNVTTENKSGGIVSIFMIPKTFSYPATDIRPTAYTKTVAKKHDNLGGYVPNNKKLFTYPFNLLYVSDNMGRTANYRYEFFAPASNCQFHLEGVMSCSPEIQLVPLNYSGVEENINERLVITDFPQCAYNIDTFAAWLAQNKASLTVGGISEGIGAAINLATMNVSGFVSQAERVAGKLAQIYDTKTLPPQNHGKQSSSINIATGEQGFHFYYAFIRPEYAKIIDGYFDRYGYATHLHKVPNTDARPFWCYTKTVGCTITGEIPSDDISKICDIFNNGVTFWKYRANMQVGNYNQDNRV